MRGRLRAAKTCGLMAGVVLLSWLALELPWNTNLFGAEHWLGVPFPLIAVAWAVIALAVLGVYLVGQCSWWLVPLVPVLCCCFGIGQHFVNEFKSSSIMPSDFTVLGTAAAVAGGYTYSLTPRIIVSAVLAVTAVAFAIAAAVSERSKRRLRRRPKQCAENRFSRRGAERGAERTGARGCTGARMYAARGYAERRYAAWVYACVKILAGLSCFAAIAALAASPACISFLQREEEKTGIGAASSWDLMVKYEADGFIPGFILVNASARPPIPAGYSDSVAQAVQRTASEAYRQQLTPEQKAAQKQFESLKPTVIAVLNESFADLNSIYGDMGVGYAGPEFFRAGVPDTLLQGKISVPVLGGGTCNSEFEFLTSTPIAFAGDHHYPFVHFNFSHAGNVARSFKELGYSTAAVHPMAATDFSRDQVFSQMGFDKFVAEDAFEDAPVLHMGATDRAVYQKTLDMLASDPSPQFIFDITMQNHGGYRTKLIPEEMLPKIQPEGLSAQTTAELNQYLGLIHASDSDLQWFVQQLRDLERPVVLIFFGDHQPLFTPDLGERFAASGGDDSAAADSMADDAGAGDAGAGDAGADDAGAVSQESAEISSAERLYTTNYFVWANYEVAGRSAEISAAQRSAEDMKQETRQDMSLDILASAAMRAVGGPLTEYQQASLYLRRSMPQLNQYGIRAVGGEWYSPTNTAGAPFESGYRDLALIGYANVQSMQR